MGFEFISTADAIDRDGLRMVVVGNIPSPWGEAAKGIFHVKGIDWAAVRLDYEDDRQKQWTGQRSGPVAFFNNERPRTGWAEILLLAERIQPDPPLLPADAAERALAMGLSHEICGELGLGWSRRMQLVFSGLDGRGGFHPKVGAYLAKKYSYAGITEDQVRNRVHALLEMLAARLKHQVSAGSDFLVGDTMTAVDIYSAAVMALFRPFPDELCPMDARTRAVFEIPGEETAALIDPILIDHRDRIYHSCLELPMRL